MRLNFAAHCDLMLRCKINQSLRPPCGFCKIVWAPIVRFDRTRRRPRLGFPQRICRSQGGL